jgi:hypothetical protein
MARLDLQSCETLRRAREVASAVERHDRIDAARRAALKRLANRKRLSNWVRTTTEAANV